MSENTQIVRRCKDCPKRTQAVCRHAFGAYWCIKSEDGAGCAHPLDGVAEAWRKAGWTPGGCKSVPVALSVVEPPKPAPPEDARAAMPSRKTVYVQLALTAAAEPPPLSDSDY